MLAGLAEANGGGEITVDFALGAGRRPGSSAGMVRTSVAHNPLIPAPIALRSGSMALTQDLEGTRSPLIPKVIFCE